MSRGIRYAARRLLLAVPVLVAMSVLVFLILHLAPGDPVQAVLGLHSTPRLEAVVRSQLHLDEGLPGQYLHWVEGVVRGELGRDYASGAPVTERLEVAMPVTAELAVATITLGGVVGVSIGALAATRGRWSRRSAQGFVVLGTAIPDFWMGIMLVLLFTTTLAVLPPSGYTSFAEDPVANLRYLALPVASLAIFQAAYFARATMSALEDALQSPFVLFLRAKGISRRRIVWRHALRNASVPVVTLIGLQFGAILGGVIVIETLFSLPGVGKLLFDAITRRDYAVVQGCVLVIGTLFILVNLVTDLIVGWLDPRIGDGVTS